MKVRAYQYHENYTYLFLRISLRIGTVGGYVGLEPARKEQGQQVNSRKSLEPWRISGNLRSVEGPLRCKNSDVPFMLRDNGARSF